jgi:hypothetical protein
MVRAMQYRDMVRALLDNDCTPKEGKGPGVVRDTIKKLACLPKGWLE